jgi:hypothetical protein
VAAGSDTSEQEWVAGDFESSSSMQAEQGIFFEQEIRMEPDRDRVRVVKCRERIGDISPWLSGF